MELGVLGFDGVQGVALKQKWATRSDPFLQEGSGFYTDASRASKLPKAEASPLPYFHHMATPHTKDEGYYCGDLNGSGGMYLLSEMRGPFTASQRAELEQQAMIYKHIIANEPIPLNLLIPIRKAFESAGLYALAAGNYKNPAWGWGPFHLGYSNSTDPEPGRCRRTDGKKWRCAKEAATNQKYCEKHMNRGRHRSRKHVEGQGNGHSVSTDTKSSTTKLTPPSAAASSAPSNSYDTNLHYYQLSAANPNSSPSVNRKNSVQGLQDAMEVPFLSSNINLNCNEISFPNSKHQDCCEELTLNVYGVPSSGSRYLNYQREAEIHHDRLDIHGVGLQSPSQMSMRLPRELEMSLGVGSQGQSHRQPSSWEAFMGGPLGEALRTSSISNSAGSEGIGSCQVSS